MFINIVKGLASRFKQTKFSDDQKRELLENAVQAKDSGDHRLAADLYRDYLKIEPRDTDILNNLGVCLAEGGNIADAYTTFDLAYQLDDSNMAVAVNYARHLIDNKKLDEAMPHIVRARLTLPQYPYLNAVYATTRLALGNAILARRFILQAWLGQFESLRMANSYLFTSAYADISERELASEHLFWAETSPTGKHAVVQNENSTSDLKSRKLRIGYWSPDFRSHSVRYFFRPLLIGHDREKVELFIYHDSHESDDQTEAIRILGDSFHDVSKLGDQALCELMVLHDLDVLVEVAGHTSSNRLNLLKNRLAKIQLSGLAYPPTTGLSTLDGKFMDPYVLGPNPQAYYSEEPLVLKSSFWCFDPLEKAPMAEMPPVIKNGFITFACVGNISKINKRMLEAWREILRRVPRSRLIIRSVNFLDVAAVEAFKTILSQEKMPVERIDLAKPAGGEAFFTTYNDVDIILDTFPFNGGTTTCFAVYMGVPVISLCGESLLSRMGASVLSNVGAPDMAVSTVQQYIAAAVALSQDVKRLKKFKSGARKIMQESSLGNGKIFATDVENAYRTKLGEHEAGKKSTYRSDIAPLPAKELIRRAYQVLAYGHKESAARIVEYCLRAYPDFGPAHILATEQYTSKCDYIGAGNYLLEQFDKIANEHLSAVLFNIVRCYLLAGQADEARRMLDKISTDMIQDNFDQLQLQLYQSRLGVQQPKKQVAALAVPPSRILCLMPCDQIELFDGLTNGMKIRCSVPAGVSVEYIRCAEAEKIAVYSSILKREDVDYILIIQKNVQIGNEHFFSDLLEALRTQDLIGFSGARRWSRTNWKFDDFEHKFAGFITKSTDENEGFELYFRGHDLSTLVTGAVILDGALLAFKRCSLSNIAFNEEFTQAGLLLEEAWSFDSSQAGFKVGVHRNLGVEILAQIQFDEQYLASAKNRILELRGLDPFALLTDDNMSISVPVDSTEHGVAVAKNYLND